MRELKIDFSKFRSIHRPFGKFKRKLIFLLIFFINILINVDHGALPAGAKTLQEELGLDQTSFGAIGSLVYLGLVLGAISAGPIFSSYSSKWVIVVSIIISSFFLYMFTVSETVFPLALSRIGCGFFQVNGKFIFNKSKIIINFRFSVIFIFLCGLTNLEFLIKECYGLLFFNLEFH